jgi:toxin-antitoxin system PIN domain toxin
VDAVNHGEYVAWLTEVLEGDEAFGLSDVVLSGFLRVATHPGIWNPPSDTADALLFVDQLREAPNAVYVSPGPRHWAIFVSLCKEPGVRGKLIPDAYFAALAIENGAEWITDDRGFARFQGLNWRRPFGS